MTVNCRKHCVQSYNVFDFLRDVVSRVPDYGHGHGHGHAEAGADDRAISKRRFEVQYLCLFCCFTLLICILLFMYLTFNNAVYYPGKLSVMMVMTVMKRLRGARW